MTLPKTNCYLCNKKMSLDNSVLVGYCFKNFIDERLKQYGSKEKLVKENKVINLLTMQYVNQFEMDDSHMENKNFEMFGGNSDKLYRLEVVLHNIQEGKHLYLVNHYGCMTSGVNNLEIPLNEINSPTKINKLTDELFKTPSFNQIGWIKTIDNLF